MLILNVNVLANIILNILKQTIEFNSMYFHKIFHNKRIAHKKIHMRAQ